MAQLKDLIVTGDTRVLGNFYSKDLKPLTYATCSTAAATAEKIITIVNNDNWSLVAGAMICIKFSATNTAHNPTFNVEGTGAKSIWYNTSLITTSVLGYAGTANRPSLYMYDGTQYIYLGWSLEANDNTIPSAYCSVNATTQAKTASCSGYNLLAKSYIQVIITNSNTVQNAITLNINGKGAKPIYINGTASSSSNYTLPAGSYLVYYDGTNYYFRTDGKITGDITGNAATADKWKTARTLTIDGDVEGNVILDGSSNVSLNLKRRGASVGQSAAVSESTNVWYKFAEVTIDDSYTDRTIIFHVCKSYADESGYVLGILKAHIRTNGNKQWESSSLVWEFAGTDIGLENFILAHTNNSTSPTKAELWCKCAASHIGYHFEVLSEGNRSARTNNLWTLFNTWTNGGEASIPSTLVQQQSTLTIIKNNIAGNAATVNGLTVQTAVPTNAKFTDTTYSSKTAANGGTDVSLVTTGEKYIWNNKSNLTIGTTSTTAAKGDHTHTLSLAADSGTNALTLAANTKYKLTAGGSSYIFTTPSDTTYSDATTSAHGLLTANDKSKIDYTNIAYGTCSTEAATAAKVISVTGNSKWSLQAGAIIAIKFTTSNTANNPTFNVNNTGAKSVWFNTSLITTSNLNKAGYQNRPSIYMYDGTQYVWLSWSADDNTTYSNASLGQGYGTCTTANGTAAKVVTLSSYALTTGGVVSVKFNADVDANATMNINSKGAKAIYNKGAAIAAGVIKAGDIATFIYNGSQYHLISVDRWQKAIVGISRSGTTFTATYADGTTSTFTQQDNNDNTKVTVANTNPTTGTWYYPIWYTGVSGTGTVNANDGFRYHSLQGTASAKGTAYLQLGNNTATGTAGNKCGILRLYAEKSGYGEILYIAGATNNTTHTLPSTSGTLLNTGTTSFTRDLTSGTKIGSIKINGTSTDIYAPAASSYSTGNATTAGITKLYTSTGTNTDGAMTQKAVNDLIGDINTLMAAL